MRRLAPRPLAAALAGVVTDAEPATLLAHVQTAWEGAVGVGLAASARPLSERDGVVTVACESAVWAQELDLLGHDLLLRLNDELAVPAEATDPSSETRRSLAAGLPPADRKPGPVVRLRFVVGSLPNG